MTWAPESFELAYMTGPHVVEGYTYRGLGLHKVLEASPKGRRPEKWVLTHLGSGLRVVSLDGNQAIIFAIAAEIAEAGEWDFLSVQGWRDRFPDGPDKVAEIAAKYPQQVDYRGGRASNRNPLVQDVAMQIAANRA